CTTVASLTQVNPSASLSSSTITASATPAASSPAAAAATSTTSSKNGATGRSISWEVLGSAAGLVGALAAVAAL
ncbi:hypothetical protein FRC01_012162, partial [Tulasnella sp. 417]